MFKINKHFCDVAFLNKKIVEEYNMHKDMIHFILKKGKNLPNDSTKGYKEDMWLFPETICTINNDPYNSKKDSQIKTFKIGHYRDANELKYPSDIMDEYYDKI